MQVLSSIRTISIILCLAVFALVVSCINSFALVATLSWEQPDDARVVGYHVYIGDSQDITTPTYQVASPTQTTQVLSDLTKDSWYYVFATSVDAEGRESVKSDILHFKAEEVVDGDVVEIDTQLKSLQINIKMGGSDGQ